MIDDTIEIRSALAVSRSTLRDVLDRPGTRAVLLAGSTDPNAKMTVVLLDTYGPAFVVKVPTTQAAESAVRIEGDVLRRLAELPLGSLANTIPRAVGTIPHERRTALVSTALPGTPMAVAYHGWHHTARRRHVRRDFALASAWLAELQSRTTALFRPVTLVSDAIKVIERRFADHPDRVDALRALAGPAGRLAEHMTPRTVVHGDFWYGNVLADGHRVVGVVDWESCEIHGEPLRDVARFAVSYALYLDRHTRPGRRVRGHRGLRAESWEAGLLHLLEGDGWFPMITQNYLTVAMGRLGVPAHLWRDVAIGGVADVAATADHPTFAENHLKLLATLAPSARPTTYASKRRVTDTTAPSSSGRQTGRSAAGRAPMGSATVGGATAAALVEVTRVWRFDTDDDGADGSTADGADSSTADGADSSTADGADSSTAQGPDDVDILDVFDADRDGPDDATVRLATATQPGGVDAKPEANDVTATARPKEHDRAGTGDPADGSVVGAQSAV